MKKLKGLLSVLLAGVMATMLILPALAADSKIDYVAFGDSVSAGVRGGVGAPGSEQGSDKGYTDDIAGMLKDAGVLGSFNEDFCKSGETAKLLAQKTDVLKDATTDAAKRVKDAEIATLDIGANDLLGPLYAYYATLKSVNDVDPMKAKQLLESMTNDLYNGLAAEVQSNIEIILQNILTANSAIKIYVMGYYNPLPTLSALFGVDLNKPTAYLNTYIQKAITDTLAKNTTASISYVPTFDAMAASTGSLVSTDIHPTEAGYMVIAKEFWKQISPMISATAASAVPATATPSTTPFTMNGKQIAFNAYLINGNNYLKLRDVAMLLNGTSKQISITWDSATNSIAVTSGKPYTPTGGELTPLTDKSSQTATPSTNAITYNGTALSLTAYLINNNNYIKFRDLAKAFDFAVDYDAATNSVAVDLTKGYTEPAA